MRTNFASTLAKLHNQEFSMCVKIWQTGRRKLEGVTLPFRLEGMELIQQIQQCPLASFDNLSPFTLKT